MNIDKLRKKLKVVGRPWLASVGFEATLKAEKNDPKSREETRAALSQLSDEELQVILEDRVGAPAFVDSLMEYHPKVLVNLFSSPKLASFFKDNLSLFNRLFSTLPNLDGKDAVELLEAVQKQGINLNLEDEDWIFLLKASIQNDRSLTLTKHLLNLHLKVIDEALNQSRQGKFPIFLDFTKNTLPSPQNLALLIEKGFNLNVQDELGNTLLHMAKNTRDYRNLMRLKANPTVKNKKNLTPLIKNLLNYLRIVQQRPFLIVLQMQNMSEQDRSRWREYWINNWRDLCFSNSIPVNEARFVETMAFFDENYLEMSEFIYTTSAVLGVGSTTQYPFDTDSCGQLWHKLDPHQYPKVGTEISHNQSEHPAFELLCRLLDRYVGEMDNSDPDKKLMLEILEAHQFTRDHLQDLDLPQKLQERHAAGRFALLPGAGWIGHLLGLAMKTSSVFLGNRGALVDNEPFGACQFTTQNNSAQRILEFMTQVVNSGIIADEEYDAIKIRTIYQGTTLVDSDIDADKREFAVKSRVVFRDLMKTMVDLSKPDGVVNAKPQQHLTCFLTGPLINIQMMLKALGSLDPHKRYKDMTSKFRDYIVQFIVEKFHQAKQDKNGKIIYVLKIFIRKILGEHYNIHKPNEQEVLRAAELLKLIDPQERDDFIREIVKEIQKKWILLKLFEHEKLYRKTKVIEILRKHDHSETGWEISEDKMDKESFVLLLNLLCDHGLSSFFDEVTGDYRNGNWGDRGVLQDFTSKAKDYIEEVVNPFFEKTETPDIQQKILRFSEPSKLGEPAKAEPTKTEKPAEQGKTPEPEKPVEKVEKKEQEKPPQGREITCQDQAATPQSPDKSSQTPPPKV